MSGFGQDVEGVADCIIPAQAVVGASAAPLGVPGVPVALKALWAKGCRGRPVTAEALEDLGRRDSGSRSLRECICRKRGGKLSE